jgi:serine/threonine-protein phosphatase 6 regulatory ankyrin repeat subunit B
MPDLALLIEGVLKGNAKVTDVEAALDQGLVNARLGPTTVLVRAVQAQHTGLVSCLLRRRADVNMVDPKGVTPLHLAVFDGHHEVIQSLLDGSADVNALDRFGQTPLFFAPHRGVCEQLVKARAEVNLVNYKGQTALHLAAHAGLNDTVYWLSEALSPVAINAQDRRGRTAAYLAARKSFRMTTSILKEHGANTSIVPTRYQSSFAASKAAEARSFLQSLDEGRHA